LQNNITCDIMNKKKIRKLEQKIAQLRRRKSEIKSRELFVLAQALGRERVARGGEPTFVSTLLPHSRPITIPGHRFVNRFTAGGILDRFEEDLFQLKELYE
jgi:hypothetical protein